VGGAWIIRCIFERLSQICPKRPFKIHCSWMFKFHWPQKTDRYDRLLWVKETLRLFMFCRVFTLHRCCFQFSCSLGVVLTKTHIVGECMMTIKLWCVCVCNIMYFFLHISWTIMNLFWR
jgi:hypothetical protein